MSARVLGAWSAIIACIIMAGICVATNHGSYASYFVFGIVLIVIFVSMDED